MRRSDIGSYNYFTLSQEETSRWSLWLENRRLETPSDGGFESSRPAGGGGMAVMAQTPWRMTDEMEN